MSVRDILPNATLRTYVPSNNTWDLIGLIVLISALAIILVIVLWMTWVDVPTTNAMIEKLSCGELIDYIADKEKFWGYAEHRYTWTCEA